MGRRKYRDLTIRKEPCDKHISFDVAIHLYRKRVVIFMPTRRHPWRRGKLIAVLPSADSFRVVWSNRKYSNLKGLWRIHDAKLFTAGQLPAPISSAKLQKSTNKHSPKEGHMAAKAAKKGAKKSAKKAASDNVRIADLSTAERKSMAASIKRMRKEGVPWDGDDGICAELGLGSALQGRNLLREFGGESLIREQESSNGSRASAKKAPAKRARSRARDEDDEDEAPTRTRARRKVTVKRGRGKAANPS